MKYKDNKDVEVLDPSDNRYKDDDYFKREQEYRDISEHHNTIRYHYGCGCPFGCFYIDCSFNYLNILAQLDILKKPRDTHMVKCVYT